MLYKRLKKIFNKEKKNKSWHRNNKHNSTWLDDVSPENVIEVGSYTYGPIKVFSDSDNYKLIIGNMCSIAHDATFLLCAEHDMNKISTFPFVNKVIDANCHESSSKGNIVIGDDVWIGYGAIIMSGIHIGQGAVIAANAVVNCDVPPYCVYGGIPAKYIKKRFDDEVIDFLSTLDYSKVDNDMIKNHIQVLNMDISDKTLEEIKSWFEWFPRKQ